MGITALQIWTLEFPHDFQCTLIILQLWSYFCEDKYTFNQCMCFSWLRVVFLWFIQEEINITNSEEAFLKSVYRWLCRLPHVMEKMLRERIWEGNSAVEEFSTSIFTLLSESGCYGIADGHRCHAGISVRAELRRRSMLEWLTSSELYWPTSERTHARKHTASL